MGDNAEFHAARDKAFRAEFKKLAPSPNILREDGWWLGFYDGWVAAMEDMNAALIADGIISAEPKGEQAPEPPETIMGFPVAAFEEIEMASPEDAIKFGSYKASEGFALVRDDGRFVFRKR